MADQRVDQTRSHYFPTHSNLPLTCLQPMSSDPDLGNELGLNQNHDDSCTRGDHHLADAHHDPDFGINVVNLGTIYGIELNGSAVHITMNRDKDSIASNVKVGRPIFKKTRRLLGRLGASL